MSSGDTLMEEPMSKKSRMSPGLVGTRSSMDFGDFGLPDELLDTPSTSISNGPTSNGVGGRLTNGPSASSSPFASSTSMPNCSSSMFTPSSYPNQYVLDPSTSNSGGGQSTVLKNLLQGDNPVPSMMQQPGTGPRSVPTSVHGNGSPQRPPTAPGPTQMPPNFTNRSPMNHMLSPPNPTMSRSVGPRAAVYSDPVTMTVPHNSTNYTITTSVSMPPGQQPRMMMMQRPQMNGPMPGANPQMRMLNPGHAPQNQPPHMNMQRHPINRPMHGQYVNGPGEFVGMNGNGGVMMGRHDEFISPSPLGQGQGNGPMMTSPHYGPGPGGPQRPPYAQAPVNSMTGPSTGHGLMMDASPLPPGATMSQPSHMAGAYPPGPSPGQPAGGPPLFPSGAGGAQNQNPDEKRKLIQQQLVLLLHAHKCQQREVDNGQLRQPCDLPHCSTMKAVLQHMTHCDDGRACTFTHCASSRQIIQHWKNCQREDCPVCLPLRNISDPAKRQQTAQGGDAAAHLGGRSAAGSDGGPLSNSSTGSMPRPNQTPAFGAAAPGAPPNAANLLNTQGQNQPMSFQNRLPPPEGASVEKVWHKDVNQDLRNHLVGKLVKAIFPSPDPAAIKDDRIRELINYARKVEKEMFEQANDREEYYHLLAEKIYKIQKELQEKKMKRLEAMNVQTGAAPGSATPNATGILGNLDMHAPPNREIATSSGGPTTSLNLQTSPSISTATSFIKAEPGKEMHSAQPTPVKNEIGDSIKKEEAMDTQDTNSKAGATPASRSQEPSGGEKKAESKAVVKKEQIKTEPVKRKEFDPNELRQHLIKTWSKLNDMEESIPFRFPVDPELLNIPDYFDIIKKPIALSNIHDKMNNGQYTDPWQFCDDMWLMFDNAWLYNRKNSKVYKYCTKVSEVFQEMMDPVMAELGYCCGRRYAYTPLALFCYGQTMCTIPRDQAYFCYEKRSAEYGLNVIPEKYTYCPKCFENQPQCINLSDDPTNPEMVSKDKFDQLKNDLIDYEPFVDCTQCGRKWHSVCALHNDKMFPGGFICKTCRKELSKPRIENKFTSKRLPHNVLSRHMEDRVNRHLKLKKSNVEVIIRVLASSDKEVEVKPNMKNRYCAANGGTGDIPEKFPYRTKAIFAFENINGEEICFFGLHVQEYGADCPNPNTRRVYIAYLDSVHYFEPRDLRTSVYHQILLGYMEYVKQSGYVWAHIWACPPSEGDDYIFHCHPPEQKIPKPKRLQEWYKRMLDIGIVERTVTDYKDIYKQAIDDKISSPAEMPIFEGDFWPNIIEDCIREADQEEQERRKEMEAQALADNFDEVDDDIFDPGLGKKKNPKSSKKSNKKQKAKASKKKVGAGSSGNELTDKLLQNLEKHKEVFFTIRLQTVHNHNQKIVDTDQLIQSELMDGRDTFLARCRDEHWEFSSLRRAKYSTMCLCYALHMQGRDQFVYTCNNCKGNNAKWHCSTCDDFDLCDACKAKVTHHHKLDPINSLIQEQDGDQNKDQNSRNESIQRCIQSLVHACQCRDVNCRRLSCHKMKRVVQHTKNCKKRQLGSCPVCKQLIALCCYHAKHCSDQQCQVPFCMNIRQKLHEQKQHQRRQQERKMMRRMAMQGLINKPGAAATPQQPTPGAGPGVPSQAIAPSPIPQGQSTLFPQSQPGPSAVTNPPLEAIHAVQQVQQIAYQSTQNPGPGQMNATGGSYSNPAVPPMHRFNPNQRTMSMPGATNPRMQMQMQQNNMNNPQQMQSQVSWDGSSQRMGVPNGAVAGEFVGPGGPAGPPRPAQMNAAARRMPQPYQQAQTDLSREQLQQQLQGLKQASTPEEQGRRINELSRNPVQLAALIRLRDQQQGMQQPNGMQQPPQGYAARQQVPRIRQPGMIPQQRAMMMQQQQPAQQQAQFQQQQFNCQMGPPATFAGQMQRPHVPMQQQQLMNVRSPHQSIVRSPQPALTSPSHIYPPNPSPSDQSYHR